ncbi:hypothetical protein HPB48_006060 [Haemaphysalis longicornis]|uniref:Uncharacterized protein n=1 Tax=Haemaphysalis longicornis TaxID=44386 RepID=A0A9J6GJ97_HAELO|nr:hypothetical protein HPB48_006060 [Haemaphysalis longicornis]
MIVLGHLDAKIMVVDGQNTNGSGTDVAKLIVSKSMHIKNDTNALATFQSHNGTSWMDVTIISTNFFGETENWLVLHYLTAIDHRYTAIKLFREEATKTEPLTHKGADNLLNTLKGASWLKTIAASDIKY